MHIQHQLGQKHHEEENQNTLMKLLMLKNTVN